MKNNVCKINKNLTEYDFIHKIINIMSNLNNKFQKFFIATTITIIIGIVVFYIIYENIATKRFDTSIKNTTANTKVIDANTDHNQALDVSEYAKNQGVEIPSILINFDTHSDIYLNFKVLTPKGAGIENWINEYIAKNPKVDTIYWVMSKEAAKNNNMQIFFAENKKKDLAWGAPLFGNEIKNLDKYKFVKTPLYRQPYIQEFLIEPQTAIINEYEPNSKMVKILFDPKVQYRKIKVINCTEDTLPDFKNKKVFLSIDADYISNSGFDTAENFKLLKNSKQVTQTFYSMFNTIDKKNIRPEIISLSLSPQYLPRKHHKHVQQIFNYIIQTAGKTDPIQKYKRKYDPDPDYLRKTYHK